MAIGTTPSSLKLPDRLMCECPPSSLLAFPNKEPVPMLAFPRSRRDGLAPLRIRPLRMAWRSFPPEKHR
jgi:hypothetical protein